MSATSKHTITLPTYNCKVIYIITEDVNKEALKLFKKNKAEEHMFTGSVEGVSISFESAVYYCLIQEEYLTHNTISHELHHLVMTIANDRDLDDEEAQCWIAGHLAQEVYKFLEKKNYTVKHV